MKEKEQRLHVSSVSGFGVKNSSLILNRCNLSVKREQANNRRFSCHVTLPDVKQHSNRDHKHRVVFMMLPLHSFPKGGVFDDDEANSKKKRS